jgi:hypothetical protein
MKELGLLDKLVNVFRNSKVDNQRECLEFL